MNPSRIFVWLLALCLSAFSTFSPALAAAEQLYTCGMHPQIIKKEPGNCPICGMALTPIRGNNAGPTGGDDATTAIHVTAGTVQRMNLKTDVVTRGPVSREIRNVGALAYNEEGLRDVTTKYEGWIEKLHVGATWTAVKAGDPLFEIYSPDLYNAQLNYLVALRTEGGRGDGPLTRAALVRLRLFDVSEDFITQIAQAGEPSRTYLYRAPSDGIVIEKMAVAGQMMKPGERVYRLADLSTVWAVAQIFEDDMPFVHAGQSATVRVTYGRDRDLPATVALLLPRIEEQTRTATARLVLNNPEGDLRPGMFVDVRLTAQLADSAVLVPEIAVLRSGEHNTVFLANPDGTFTPRTVQLGARNHDGRYEVLSGLAEGDRVVTSGQFMLDSESQLREAIQKMLKPAGAAETATAAAPSVPQKTPPAATAPAEQPAIAALTKLALALADAAAALATDDLAAYRRQLPALRAARDAYLAADPHAVHGPLGNFRQGPRDPADLKSAQKEFAPFSTAVADAARAQEVHHHAGLHLFQCPMAPGIGEGRWLQRDGDIKNPFFGSNMPNCGDELDVAPPADAHQAHGGMAALPPGHPPVDVTSYLLALNRESAGPTDGCCAGHSAEQAAACEHNK